MKPKIYATCKAGCQWETIHKDDFARIASHIVVEPSGINQFTIELGKEYVLYSYKLDDIFSATICVEVKDSANNIYSKFITFEITDKYKNKLTFCLLDVTTTDDGLENLLFVYEVNGERKTLLFDDIVIKPLEITSITVLDATAVYEYNEHATVVIPGKEEVVEQITEECKAYMDETYTDDINSALDGIISIQKKLMGIPGVKFDTNAVLNEEIITVSFDSGEQMNVSGALGNTYYCSEVTFYGIEYKVVYTTKSGETIDTGWALGSHTISVTEDITVTAVFSH